MLKFAILELAGSHHQILQYGFDYSGNETQG